MDDIGLVFWVQLSGRESYPNCFHACWGHKFQAYLYNSGFWTTNHPKQFFQPTSHCLSRQFSFIDILNMQTVWIFFCWQGGGEGRGQDQDSYCLILIWRYHWKIQPFHVKRSKRRRCKNFSRVFHIYIPENKWLGPKHRGLEEVRFLWKKILSARPGWRWKPLGSHTQSTESKLKSSHTGILNGWGASSLVFFWWREKLGYLGS